MNLHLRPAAPEDAPCIHAMQRAAFAPLLARYGDDGNPALETLDAVAARLSGPGRTTYVIEAQGVPIGAICVILPAEEDGGRKRLHRLFLLPACQGRGWAQAAIREVERLHGAHGWELDTIAQEEKLCHLYEKMGYQRTARTHPIGDTMTLIFYEKE